VGHADRLLVRRPKLLGTGGALIRALPLLGDAFYVLYGDPTCQLTIPRPVAAFSRLRAAGVDEVYENRANTIPAMSGLRTGRSKSTTRRTVSPRCTTSTTPWSAACRGLRAWPRDETVDLADVYGRLVDAGRLAGYEVRTRFTRSVHLKDCGNSTRCCAGQSESESESVSEGESENDWKPNAMPAI